MNIIFNNDFVSSIYVGSDCKLHKVVGGADTALNFSKLGDITLKVTIRRRNIVGNTVKSTNYYVFYIYCKNNEITLKNEKDDKSSGYTGFNSIYGGDSMWHTYNAHMIEIVT